jgi:ribosomal-protein-alanine N-acetyltransferase
VDARRDAAGHGSTGRSRSDEIHGGPFTPAQVAERLRKEVATLDQHGVQYWPIFLRDAGEHVGCRGLQPRDPGEGVWELGFQLCRVFWGRGLAREAAEAVISYPFTTLGTRALYAGHHPGNDASRRLRQGVGFRYTHDEFYPPTGQVEPCYLARSDEFPKTHGRSCPQT